MLKYQDIIHRSPLELQTEPKELAAYVSSERHDQYLKLLDYLATTDYYSAPASRNHHQAYEGGLLKHSLEVIALSLVLNDCLKAGLSMDSLIICGTIHDVGKCGLYRKRTEKARIKFETIPNPFEVPILSLLRCQPYIKLTEAEQFAILYHDGMYTEVNRGSYLAGNETPLYLVLHTADMWSGREMGERCLKANQSSAIAGM